MESRITIEGYNGGSRRLHSSRFGVNGTGLPVGCRVVILPSDNPGPPGTGLSLLAMSEIRQVLPVVLKNMHLNVSLQGWPAAVSAVALFGSCVAIYAIKVTHPEATYATEDNYDTPRVA